MARPLDKLIPQRWLRWVLIFGLWTLLGLFDAWQTWALCKLLNKNLPTDLLILRGLIEWYLWGILAPSLIDLARRFPITPETWRTSLAVQAVAIVLFALLRICLNVPAAQLLLGEQAFQRQALEWFEYFFSAQFLPYVLICVLIVGLGHLLEYSRRLRERELRESFLQTQLAQARLQLLKQQLHPHFLFNTLNAISTLVHRDAELAEQMIARLGDLLRVALDTAGIQEVPLRQELDFVRPYLEIEQARLGPRLRVGLEIEPDTLEAAVPNLFLQPLIENAIRHAIAPRSEAGTLVLRAWRQRDRLFVQVADDGPGLSGGPESLRQGIGLTNTRARLRQLYGAAQQVELHNTPGGGLTVTVTLPYRRAGNAEEAAEPPPRPVELAASLAPGRPGAVLPVASLGSKPG